MTTTGRPVVAVDLDDVCGDRLSMIAQRLRDQGTPVPPSGPLSWSLREWGVRNQAHYDELHYGTFVDEDGYRRMPVVPGAVPALCVLRDAGFRVVVLTGRLWTEQLAARVLCDTGWWLDHHGFPADDIAFVTDKTAVVADVYVEDGPHFVEALQAAGRRVLIYDQPYNRELPGHRATNWNQVLHALLPASSVEGASVGPLAEGGTPCR